MKNTALNTRSLKVGNVYISNTGTEIVKIDSIVKTDGVKNINVVGLHRPTNVVYNGTDTDTVFVSLFRKPTKEEKESVESFLKEIMI